MDFLETVLPVKLYNEFKNNNLLPIIEAITNDKKNLISVDIYDIETYEDKDFIGRLDYSSNESVPTTDLKPESLIICFNIPSSATLVDIMREDDKISKAFGNIDRVYGTYINDSLEKGNIIINCLMFKKLELKDRFSEKFYNDLVKCGFIKDIEQITRTPGLINIDIDDFKTLSDGEVVGCISQYFDNLEDDYVINKISDKVPTDCVFNVSGGDMLNLSDLDLLIDKLRKVYPDLNIIFGSNKNDESIPRLKVQALLTYSDKPKDNRENRKMEKLLSETIKVLEERKQKCNDENDLVYNVALYCINNPITVNGIQNQFELGFNRVVAILDRLEKLEIISIKVGTKPRRILITDKDEIKKRIYVSFKDVPLT